MYAVIRTGGKQYRVAEGDVLDVEALPEEPGGAITFSEVLLVADGAKLEVGRPLVDGATVSAELIGHVRGEKIRIWKLRRRKHHLKRQGHRQRLTRVRITGIHKD